MIENIFIALTVVLLAMLLSTGACYIERTRFDWCVRATDNARYCTLVHPWGAHQ